MSKRHPNKQARKRQMRELVAKLDDELALEAIAPGLAVAGDGVYWWPVWNRELEHRERRAVCYALASRVLSPVRGLA